MIIPLAPERTNTALDALASRPHCWLNIQPAAPPRPADLSLKSWCLTMHQPEWGAAWGYSILGGWLCLWLCWSWVPHHPLPQSINSCPNLTDIWQSTGKVVETVSAPVSNSIANVCMSGSELLTKKLLDWPFHVSPPQSLSLEESLLERQGKVLLWHA